MGNNREVLSWGKTRESMRLVIVTALLSLSSPVSDILSSFRFHRLFPHTSSTLPPTDTAHPPPSLLNEIPGFCHHKPEFLLLWPRSPQPAPPLHTSSINQSATLTGYTSSSDLILAANFQSVSSGSTDFDTDWYHRRWCKKFIWALRSLVFLFPIFYAELLHSALLPFISLVFAGMD